MDRTMSLIPLIDKENVRKKAKPKRERYTYLKQKVEKLVPWLYQQVDKSKFGEITTRVRDFAKEIGLENKSDAALYSGLRFTLFYEGLILGMTNNGKENFFKIKKVEGGRDGFSPSVLKTLDNIELDGWQIKRNYDYMCFNHSLKEDRNGTYILESEGNIFFDRRSLTEGQALDFVKYMSSKDLRAPDFVYLTPINVVLTDKYLDNYMRYIDFDVNKIGREFRIIKSGDSEFTVTSIYGKECLIRKFEMDSLIKRCSLYGIISCFDSALLEEKIPERIDILKIVIPDIEKRLKTENTVMIDRDKKRLVIVNSTGIFHLSLADGMLHKMYRIDGESCEDISKYKYICVWPVECKQNSIIYNGARYDIDRTTGSILSKLEMLLREKYPDKWTRDQIMI